MDQLVKDLDLKAKQLVESLKQELGGIRTNRPSAQLVEEIFVDYAGQRLKVKQLGSISVNPPREIVISVWDKEAVGAVTKAVQDSPVKLNPSVEGTTIRLSLPSLTAERREELGRLVKKMAEEARIKIRALRDEANKKTEIDFKTKMVNEDQKFKHKERVQKATDKINEEIEKLLAGKIKEING